MRDEERKIVGESPPRLSRTPRRRGVVTQRDLTHIPEAEGNRVNVVALISATASRLPSRAPPRHLPSNITIPVTNRSIVHPTIITLPDYTLEARANKPHVSREYVMNICFNGILSQNVGTKRTDKSVKDRKDATSSSAKDKSSPDRAKKIDFKRASGHLARMRPGDFNAWLTTWGTNASPRVLVHSSARTDDYSTLRILKPTINRTTG